MADREKLIKALECCNAPNNHDDCPYNGAQHYNICTHRLLNDALELLKAQEPRVMTLEEIQELHVYWVEDYNGSLIPETVMCIEPHFGNLEGSSKEIQTIPVVRMGNGYAPVITKINHHYNIKWRCWTSRPTDEQREAVKWE